MSADARSLEGRVAVVAGASSGIGLAVAQRLHAAGATVHALARRADALASSAGAATGSDRYRGHAVDVTDQAAVAAALHPFCPGGIDVVVYSAGSNVARRAVGVATPEEWKQVVDVNLNGAFHLVHAVLPAVRARRGTVIFIVSASAAWPNHSGAAYQASKAGLIGFARSAAYDEHANGVRFSVVLPGLVDTAHLDRRAVPPSPRARAQMLQPSDVADACWFLATLPERAYVPELVLLPTTLQAPGKTDERALVAALDGGP